MGDFLGENFPKGFVWWEYPEWNFLGENFLNIHFRIGCV